MLGVLEALRTNRLIGRAIGLRGEIRLLARRRGLERLIAGSRLRLRVLVARRSSRSRALIARRRRLQTRIVERRRSLRARIAQSRTGILARLGGRWTRIILRVGGLRLRGLRTKLRPARYRRIARHLCKDWTAASENRALPAGRLPRPPRSLSHQAYLALLSTERVVAPCLEARRIPGGWNSIATQNGGLTG